MRARAHPQGSQKRTWILFFALTGWALIVGTRLYWLQVHDHVWLASRAQHQQQRSETVPADRGLILDRGLHPLAMSLGVDSICADPAQVHDAAATAAPLAQALGLDANDLEAKLQAGKSFVWVARQVTAAQAAAVKTLNLPGVCYRRETRRFYPEGSVAANVLGFVGADGNGLGGLELSWDSALRGHDGAAVMQVDARDTGYDQVERAPQPGANLVLTLDQNIQYIAQDELDRRVQATGAERGIAIVEDPRTGAILAMAVSPSFNPNQLDSANAKSLGNPAVSEVYEPGSVFKLVTLSAALQEGLVKPDDLIDCENGRTWVGGVGKRGRWVKDHHPYGMLTVNQVLQKSSDVGAIKIGEKLGNDRFYQYIQAYGFGQSTGVKLPGESRGIAPPARLWSPVSIGAVSMGQEIAATPLQVISLVATLADDGVYHAPRVVAAKYSGPTPATAPELAADAGRRVVSPEVAAEMKAMMALVLMPGGTAPMAQLNGYTAAGKTGTAQKIDPATHLYSTTHFVASFGGFAPINDPAVTILVVIDSPRGEHEGGPTAGPVFKGIAERVLPYLGVAHDVPASTPLEIAARRGAAAPDGDSEQLSAPPDLDADEAATAPAAPAAPAKAIAAAPAPPPPTAAATPPPPGMVEVTYHSGATVTVPDFSGQTVRQVLQSCQKLGLEPTLEGSGVARAQAPAAGATLAPGAKIKITFRY